MPSYLSYASSKYDKYDSYDRGCGWTTKSESVSSPFSFDPTLMQQVLYISKRKWEPDIHHYGKADNLRTGFEIAKGYWIGHGLEANFHSTVGQGGLF